MSNQILIDLYKEASEFAYKICKEEGRTGGPTDQIWNTLSTGKFAELIVKECANKADELGVLLAGHRDIEGRDIAYSIRDGIKEHFGVEE